MVRTRPVIAQTVTYIDCQSLRPICDYTCALPGTEILNETVSFYCGNVDWQLIGIEFEEEGFFKISKNKFISISVFVTSSSWRCKVCA